MADLLSLPQDFSSKESWLLGCPVLGFPVVSGMRIEGVKNVPNRQDSTPAI